jgi:hypothetical protein
MTEERPATWKVVIAAILDFLLVFILGGMLIASATGDTTEGGFQLSGWPAVALFALIALYFWGMGRLGGTLFRRLFRIA